jgi:hypothetical protein
MQAGHFHGRWLWHTTCAILYGIALYIVGWWCLESTNIPPPAFALPLPQRFLTGLGFLLLNPISLITISLIFTASQFLASKLSKASSVTVITSGLAVVLAGAFWVPNPFTLWPMEILGDHTLPELIGRLFTFHIIPSPGVSLNAPVGFDALIRWQVKECATRFCILITAWIACLVTIWIIDRRLKQSNDSNQQPPDRAKSTGSDSCKTSSAAMPG